MIGFGDHSGGAQGTVIDELSDVCVVGVRSGFDHTIVWDDQANVYGRGDNSAGQLGLGHFHNHWSRFVRVDSLSGVNVADVQCGHDHTVLLTTDGKVFSWGFNNYCLLYTSPSPRDQRGSRMPSSA